MATTTMFAILQRFRRRLWWCFLALMGVTFLAIILLLGLRLDWFTPTPSRHEDPWTFRDGFEDVATFNDLYPRDLSRWHGLQRVPESNTIDISSEKVHSGRQSLKLVADQKRNDVTSKADVLREQLPFVKGDRVWSECWFWLQGGGNAEHVFLWDLETTRKWQQPGRRVYLQTGESLASDLGKWFRSSVFRQPPGRAIPFPTDRWVRLRVYLVLSENSDGVMEVWQDDTQVINARGQTLPTAKTIYDRLEVGITANGSTDHPQTLYVDDVAISNRPLW